MSRHVQNADSSVVERRLRPIYDWLDTGNNKKALQECEKVLKKTPNLQCAKALKALTLLRIGRESECNSLLDLLCNEKPVDENTLQAMTLCYREMQQLEKVCKLYETAVKVDPSNEELHTQLFMSYVRICDFKSQQQSAMALYKQKPKNPYYCWNVMSIVLQATRGEGSKDKAKQKLLLSLAERMMKKHQDEGKIDAEQEVQLYLLVLEVQEKYAEIVEMLDGPLGEKLQSANLAQVKLKYVTKMEQWDQVNFLCKYILNESFDRWEIWKQYIHSVFELYDKAQNGNDLSTTLTVLELADNTAEKCHEFICSMIESGADNQFLLRGPYLARFELCVKLRERNIETQEMLGDIMELFAEYFRKFGHKPCCVQDLKIYLKLLNEEQITQLGSKLVKEVGIGVQSVPKALDQMQRHIGALQLSRLCGAYRNISLEHMYALVTALILHYQHGYEAHGMGLPSTDLGPSDNYAILAAHIFYDMARTGNQDGYLIAAVTLLEVVLKNSPSNFHAKLLVVKLYHLLGDGMGANTVFYSLDIKHLQLDSLGYIHCGQLAATGLFSLCAIHYETTLKFFSSSYKDSTDHLTFSYKYGSFGKLDEFMDFRERLNHSMHYTTVVVDRIMLTLVDCANIDSLYDMDISLLTLNDSKIEWDKLRDNRDLDVYVNWEPEFANQSVGKCKEVQRLFSQDVDFLMLRCHIVCALSQAIDVLKSTDGVRQQHLESVGKSLKDWKELEDRVRGADPKPTSEDLVVYPPPSRLHAYLQTSYLSCLSVMFEFFVFVCQDQIDKAEIACNTAEEEIGKLADQLEAKILSTVPNDFRAKKKGMELLVNNLEIISVACVICMITKETMKPAQNKKSKKKQPTESKAKELLIRIVNKLKTEVTKLNQLLPKWSSLTSDPDLLAMLNALSLVDDKTTFYQNVMQSYAVSQKEIQGVLNNKLKSLNGLI